LDGSRGLIYLNGKPVATNNTVPVRPWQVLSRTNYIGESQFGADPAFNGRIDSLRIYGRALGSDEILRLSEAHPSLAHRFSFSNGASDSIGTAHGRLDGAAQATNNALVLDGSPGTYVNLPGGLVTGCSAVTLEFWATFGTNSDWARVFDFGNSSGGSGQDFLFFSPRTDVGTHRLALATSGGVRDHDSPGTLDGQTTHVVCIADPTTGYTAIYTNGVIESETNGSLPSLGGVSAALAYLGRSLFSADPWLNATIDEFRIYHGRLTPDEIAIDHAAGADELAIPVQLSVSNDPAGLAFSWPAYAAGFDLESSASVGPDAVWNPVAEMPTLRDDAYRLTLLPAETTRFFRLHR
jgi:hypothetical protein